MSFADSRSPEQRTLALTLALLFPLALGLSEAVLRFTHHRPLGAMTVAAAVAALAFLLRALVRGLSGVERGRKGRDSSSHIETDDAPIVSGVMSRREALGREIVAIGLALVLWPLALAWVFFG